MLVNVVAHLADGFQSHSNELSAFKQYGNAVSPPVVECLISAIIETNVFMAEDSLAENVVNYDFFQTQLECRFKQFF